MNPVGLFRSTPTHRTDHHDRSGDLMPCTIRPPTRSLKPAHILHLSRRASVHHSIHSVDTIYIDRRGAAIKPRAQFLPELWDKQKRPTLSDSCPCFPVRSGCSSNKMPPHAAVDAVAKAIADAVSSFPTAPNCALASLIQKKLSALPFDGHISWNESMLDDLKSKIESALASRPAGDQMQARKTGKNNVANIGIPTTRSRVDGFAGRRP